jgi:gliding motility-associated-like protein
MNRLRTILLTILLAVAYGAAGQGYVIDSVCQGAERHYRIDGEAGSTYTWTLTDPYGAITTLPETADTITVIWDKHAGDYILATLQTSIYGCDSLQLGTIKVFENPVITGIQTFNSTNGLANGYAIVNTGSTTSTFEYSLDGTNWQTSDSFTKLPADTYTAWVRNENGCILSHQFTIFNSVVGVVEIRAGNVVSCITLPIGIPINANDFTDISEFTIQVAFDPSMMTFDAISQMNSLLNNGTLSFALVSPGMLEIGFVTSTPLTLPADDQLFSLNFNGLSAGLTPLKWDLLNCVILSGSRSEIPTIFINGAVDIRPVPQIYTAGSGAYCEGTSLKLTTGSLTGQVLSYEWTSPNGTSHNGNAWDLGNLHVSDEGVYAVTAYEIPACATTEMLNVQVYPNPNISISNSDTLCSSQEIKLDAGSGYTSYKWQDGTTEPQIIATTEGIYWVTVTDFNGCQATDSVLLHECELMLWMPNVFTPNGDGLNDVFLSRYKPGYDITFQMLIFNKWGEQLFSTNDIDKGWDGTYKGVLCAEDLYTWIVTFSSPDNFKFLQKSPQSGNVMLLK